MIIKAALIQWNFIIMSRLVFKFLKSNVGQIFPLNISFTTKNS